MANTVGWRFGGLVLGSADPDRLAAWYRAAFSPDVEPGEVLGRTMVEVGGARLVFDQRADVATEAAEPGRILFNIFVADVQAAEEHLTSLGVEWVRPVESIVDFGSVGTFKDPDGNYVQLLHVAVPAPAASAS
jgi:predicted enzyme related to lactoylglutathione lyase